MISFCFFDEYGEEYLN